MIAGSAYLYTPTGQVLGPLETHACFYWNDEMKKLVGLSIEEDDIDTICGKIIDMIDTGELVDGFVTTTGKFLDRYEAAKVVKIKDKSRDWVDSEDLYR